MGKQSIASACGDDTRVEVGSTSLGAATGRNVKWIVHKGAKLTVGWFDDADVWQARLFDSANMDVVEGAVITIDRGEITRA